MSDLSTFDYILHQERMQTEAQRQRPFILLRPKMFPDGNQWCALYGDNIQEGVCGFGDTPGQAAAAFDEAWYRQKLQVATSGPTYCPTCGAEDGGTTCGMPNCGLRCGAEPVEPVAWRSDDWKIIVPAQFKSLWPDAKFALYELPQQQAEPVQAIDEGERGL